MILNFQKKGFKPCLQRRKINLHPLHLTVLKEIGSLKNSKILDVGCGYGNFLLEVSQMAEIAVGIDLSLMHIKEAKRKGLEVILADAHALPFRDDIFTHIFAIDTLEHVLSPELTLREANRVLGKGQVLISVIPIDKNIFIQHIIRGDFREARVYHNRNLSYKHGHLHSLSSIIRELFNMRQYGLRIFKVRKYKEKPLICGHVIRTLVKRKQASNRLDDNKFLPHINRYKNFFGLRLYRIYQKIFPIPSLTTHYIFGSVKGCDES